MCIYIFKKCIIYYYYFLRASQDAHFKFKLVLEGLIQASSSFSTDGQCCHFGVSSFPAFSAWQDTNSSLNQALESWIGLTTSTPVYKIIPPLKQGMMYSTSNFVYLLKLADTTTLCCACNVHNV